MCCCGKFSSCIWRSNTMSKRKKLWPHNRYSCFNEVQSVKFTSGHFSMSLQGRHGRAVNNQMNGSPSSACAMLTPWNQRCEIKVGHHSFCNLHLCFPCASLKKTCKAWSLKACYTHRKPTDYASRRVCLIDTSLTLPLALLHHILYSRRQVWRWIPISH